LRRLDTVSLEFARTMIEEETGTPLVLPTEGAEAAPVEAPSGKKLIARDEKRNPLFSELEWTADAVTRILRVPAGFMRNRTQQRIEDLARERGRTAVDLALVEEGIEHGRKLMEEMIQGYQQNPAPAREAVMPEHPTERPAGDLPLNEVGIMAVMESRRLGDTGK
jgi:Proto-chlorophyllide reductase 57 kD subunit